MEMLCHGPRKYPFSTVVVSSVGKNWRQIAAELRSHPASNMSGLTAQQMEISIALRGRHDGWIIRTCAGEDQKIRPIAGTIWLSPIGIADTEIRITKPLSRVLHLYLAAHSFTVLADEYNLPASPAHSIRCLAGLQDEMIRQLGLAVLAEMCHDTGSGRMLAETCSLMLAARLAHRYGDGWSINISSNNGRRLDELRLRRVQDYVLEHLDKDISVADLATVANLSAFHFTRLFTAATGIPPHRYVGQQRLEKAMTLLAAGAMPLSAIALNAHFSSQASFSRAFRRLTGITPGQYRRRIRLTSDESVK